MQTRKDTAWKKSRTFGDLKGGRVKPKLADKIFARTHSLQRPSPGDGLPIFITSAAFICYLVHVLMVIQLFAITFVFSKSSEEGLGSAFPIFIYSLPLAVFWIPLHGLRRLSARLIFNLICFTAFQILRGQWPLNLKGKMEGDCAQADDPRPEAAGMWRVGANQTVAAHPLSRGWAEGGRPESHFPPR